MTRQLTHLALCALLATGCMHAQADTSWALAPAWNRASDSDGLVIQKWFAGALPQHSSGLQWQGVEWQQQRYTQNGQALDGHGVNYTAQHTDAITGMGYGYKLGLNQGPTKSLLTGDVNWNQAMSSQLQWGVFASRDWVESMGALQQGIHYDLVGGNLDYQVHPRFNLTGSLAQTHFSDGHDRQQQRTRVVWDAWPEEGVTLQWAYKRQLGEKDNGTPPVYFNPERLNESMGMVGWRRRYQGWQWYARLGRGQQEVNNDSSTPARLAELQLSSPVHGSSFFKLRLGESETVGLRGPGYVYRYVDAQWILGLDR